MAIESLLERHLPRLQAFIRLRCSRAVRHKESCSDLAQSVCREVLQNLDDFEYRGEPAFRRWLFAKALSKIQDRARYYKAHKRDAAREVERGGETLYGTYYATLVTPSRDAMGREELVRLEQAFDELPEHYREVLTLARVVGLSHREIAEQMGRSVGSVRGFLDRALVQLSWILSRDEPAAE